MKTLVSFLSLFSLGILYPQSNIRELNSKIQSLNSRQKITVRSLEDNSISNEHLFRANNFKLPSNLNKEAVIVYDSKIIKPKHKNLTPYDNSRFSKLKVDKLLPEYYYVPTKNSNDKGLIFSPMIIDSKPLTYDSLSKSFVSVIRFILYSDKNNDGKILKKPIYLEITSEHLKTETPKIRIEHLNLPSTDITVLTRNATDSADLRIITKGNMPNGYKHHLKVTPILKISSNRETLQGFGVQETPLNILFRGSKSSAKETVTILSSKGSVTPSTFSLSYNESKIVQLRSEGIGDIKVKATSTALNHSISDSNEIVITQVFPWLFLTFALIGAIMGTTLRFGFNKIKEHPKNYVFSCILIGILGALSYYVLGINFLKLNIGGAYNEFAVLTFSALCALLLSPILLKKIII